MKKFSNSFIAMIVLFAFVAFGLYIVKSNEPAIVIYKDCIPVVTLVGVK